MPPSKNILIYILLFFLFAGIPVFSDSVEPGALKGVLDLRYQSLSHPVYLRGEWEFSLIEIGGDKAVTSGSRYLRVPGSWDSLTGTPYAAGVYSLRILLPENGEGTLALRFPELSQILKVRVDGREIFASGNSDSGETGYTNFLCPLPVESEMHLEVYLKNTRFRSGGLIYLPLIGANKNVRGIRERRVWLDAFYTGVLFLAAIYHFFLFARDYRNNSALFLGFSALLMILLSIVTEENTVTFLLPGFSWVLDYKIEYLAGYLNSAALLQFANRTFPYKIKTIDYLVRWLSILAVVCAVVSAFLPIRSLSRTVFLFQGILFSSLLVMLAVFVHALIERKNGSLLFFLGGLCAAVTIGFDSVYFLGGGVSNRSFGKTGLFIFILCQTLVLARLYGDAFLKLQLISANLEEEVERKTNHLQKANDLLKDEIRHRRKFEEKLKLLSTTDPLTGAANRLKINSQMEHCHNLFHRYGNSYGLVMFDIDHFKHVNDEFGHQVGDDVLKGMVRIASDHIRETDTFSRWGGEEFIILMPMLELEGSTAAAERIRRAFEEADFPAVGSVTASFAVVVPLKKELLLRDVIKRLDEKLYQAKHQGRNCVEV